MKVQNNTITFYLGLVLATILVSTASCAIPSSILIPTPPTIIKGIAYHDYNGDGLKENDEPTIVGVKLEFFSESGKKICVVSTESGGTYDIQLPRGTYKLTVDKTMLGDNSQPYRFLNVSREDFYSIDSPINIEIKDNMTYDIKLMQGFLTLPFAEDTGFYHLWYYFDADERDSFTRDWQGTARTYDKHAGTDYLMPINTPILAAAPGIVSFAGFDANWGSTIIIKHKNELFTSYCHLDKIIVNIGDRVNRGDNIGLSGKSGRPFLHPHLHFQLGSGPKLDSKAMDTYRDINNPSSLGWWTVDNSPRYP